MKSFEIAEQDKGLLPVEKMNCKLEKFWNIDVFWKYFYPKCMNCKLEKFWNPTIITGKVPSILMNYKLEKFWNLIALYETL